MAGKKSSASHKAQALTYKNENRAVKNRTRKLEKHLKLFPNDEQAKEALKKGLSYRRKTPYNRPWKSAPLQEFAAQLASVGLNGNLALKWREKKLTDLFANQEEGEENG